MVALSLFRVREGGGPLFINQGQTSCIYIYIYMFMCIYIYIHIFMYMYIYIYMHMYIYYMYTSDDVAMVKRMRVSP